MVCARMPDSTLLKKTQDVFWGTTRDSIAFGITIDAPPFLTPYVLSGLSPTSAFSPTAIFDELLFKIAVRGDRICIMVAGLLDAFVTSYNLQRTNRGPGLNFKELKYGRIKRMTPLCPARAHTYETMCLGFHPEQLRPEAFWLSKPKKKFPCYLLA